MFFITFPLTVAKYPSRKIPVGYLIGSLLLTVYHISNFASLQLLVKVPSVRTAKDQSELF